MAVTAGELVVKGKIDTTDIVRGQRDISSGFEKVKQKNQSANGSLLSLGGIAKNAAVKLTALGVAGVGALGILASKSPQLADEFARIEIATFKLSNTLGGVFEPIFDAVASGFEGFTQIVSDNESTIGSWVDFGLTVAKGALSDLGDALDDIKVKYAAFDASIEKKTGGTSFTEEFKTQTEDVKTNIEKEGLIGGFNREFGQTIDTVLNIALNTGAYLGQKVLGGEQQIFATNFFENTFTQEEFSKLRLNYNVDTVG